MVEKMKVEVEIISSDILKPSSPTSPRNKTFCLSILDQIFPPIHLDFLLVYRNSSSSKQSPDIGLLRRSLMETLSRFYPFAGRCENESTVSCNDQGIPFITTHVNCPLSDVFNPANQFDSFTKFLPPGDLIAIRPRPLSEMVPMAFQINTFACGGMILGYYMFHKLMDAASFATFLNYWSGLSSNQDHHNLVQPDFGATVTAFPPSPKVYRYSITELTEAFLEQGTCIRVVARSFIFTSAAITELKIKAATDGLPNPTRFETLAGFVWQHVFRAACDAGTASPTCPTTLIISANMRSRTTPPLPKGSIGNLVIDVEACVAQQSPLPDLAIKIHQTLASQINKKVESFLGEAGTEAVIAYSNGSGEKAAKCRSPALYFVTSLCGNGFSEADFGFWQLERNIIHNGHLYPIQKNFIFFTDFTPPNGDKGIEVRLLLEEKEMHILESNPLFLAFASPTNY